MNTFYRTYLKPAAIALLAVFVIAGISAVVFEDKGAAGYQWKSAPGAAPVMTVDSTYVDIAAPKIAGTAVSATAAQMNYLAGVTAGTAAASKAVVLGTGRQIDSLRITSGTIEGGTVTAGTLTATTLIAGGRTLYVGDALLSAGNITQTFTITGVTATSLVGATCATANSTATTTLQSAVPGSGNVVVRMTAVADANTSITFQIWK